MWRMPRGFLHLLGWEQDGSFRILGKETFASQGPWVSWALSPCRLLPLACPFLRFCGILEATGRTVPKRSAFLEGSQRPIAAHVAGERGAWLFSPE